MKTAQDQTTAPKPPLVPGPDFSSSSLLVVGTLQYHLGGEQQEQLLPNRDRRGNAAAKPLYPAEMLPDATHICLLAHQQLLTNFQAKSQGGGLGLVYSAQTLP